MHLVDWAEAKFMSNRDLRAIMVYEYKLGHTGGQASESICHAFGEGGINKHAMQPWFAKSRSGDPNLENEHGGKPASVLNHEDLEATVQQDPQKVSINWPRSFMFQAVAHFESICEHKPKQIFKEKLQDAVETWVCVIEALNEQEIQDEIVGYTKRLNLSKEVFKSLIGLSEHTFPIICLAISDQYIRKYDVKLADPFFKMRDELLEEFNEMLGDDGVFLYPTYPTTAPYHMEMLFRPFNIGYCVMFNIVGLPVTHCPMGLSRNGLPIGIQAVGAMNSDRVTAAVAEELERAFGGWISPCPIRKISLKKAEVV